MVRHHAVSGEVEAHIVALVDGRKPVFEGVPELTTVLVSHGLADEAARAEALGHVGRTTGSTGFRYNVPVENELFDRSTSPGSDNIYVGCNNKQA